MSCRLVDLKVTWVSFVKLSLFVDNSKFESSIFTSAATIGLFLWVTFEELRFSISVELSF